MRSGKRRLIPADQGAAPSLEPEPERIPLQPDAVPGGVRESEPERTGLHGPEEQVDPRVSQRLHPILSLVLKFEEPRLEARVPFHGSVPVQVVRRHVEQDADPGMEPRAGLELEARDLHDEKPVLGNLLGQLRECRPDVAEHLGPPSRRPSDRAQKLHRRALSVRAGHGHDRRASDRESELDLGDDRNPPPLRLAEDRKLQRHAGTHHDQVPALQLLGLGRAEGDPDPEIAQLPDGSLQLFRAPSIHAAHVPAVLQEQLGGRDAAPRQPHDQRPRSLKPGHGGAVH